MFTNLILGLIDDLQAEKYHFLFELIQNAEDNVYSKHSKPLLEFHLWEHNPLHSQSLNGNCGALVVINNEIGFEREHVSAICNLRKSTKSHLRIKGTFLVLTSFQMAIGSISTKNQILRLAILTSFQCDVTNFWQS